MQRLEVSGAVRPIYGSLGFKRLTRSCHQTMYAPVRIHSFSHLTQLIPYSIRDVNTHTHSHTQVQACTCTQEHTSESQALKLLATKHLERHKLYRPRLDFELSYS